MKNSTPWYSLYSTELKYSLGFTKSVYASRVPLIVAGLSFFVFILIFFNLSLDFSYINLFAFACFSALAVYLLCAQFDLCAMQFSDKALLISSSGVLSLASDRHYQLLPCSQVMPFVCRLNLVVINDSNVSANIASTKRIKSQKPFYKFIKTTYALTKFIFKDSVSDQDFRRLCRIIRTTQCAQN